MNYLYHAIVFPLLFLMASCGGLTDDFAKDYPAKKFETLVMYEGKVEGTYRVFFASQVLITNTGELDISERSTITVILMKNNVEVKRYVQYLERKIKAYYQWKFNIFFDGITSENDYDKILYEYDIKWLR